jgi:hypothetical protein
VKQEDVQLIGEPEFFLALTGCNEFVEPAEAGGFLFGTYDEVYCHMAVRRSLGIEKVPGFLVCFEDFSEFIA